MHMEYFVGKWLGGHRLPRVRYLLVHIVHYLKADTKHQHFMNQYLWRKHQGWYSNPLDASTPCRHEGSWCLCSPTGFTPPSPGHRGSRAAMARAVADINWRWAPGALHMCRKAPAAASSLLLAKLSWTSLRHGFHTAQPQAFRLIMGPFQDPQGWSPGWTSGCLSIKGSYSISSSQKHLAMIKNVFLNTQPKILVHHIKVK